MAHKDCMIKQDVMERNFMTKSTDKTTAFYCRSAVKNEKSIQNQKEGLAHYTKEHGIEKHTFYTDDGFSGNSLKRPALRKLLDDIKDGKIATVVVVDDGRLSRNFEQAFGLKQLFEKGGTTYISIKGASISEETVKQFIIKPIL